MERTILAMAASIERQICLPEFPVQRVKVKVGWEREKCEQCRSCNQQTKENSKYLILVPGSIILREAASLVEFPAMQIRKCNKPSLRFADEEGKFAIVPVSRARMRPLDWRSATKPASKDLLPRNLPWQGFHSSDARPDCCITIL
jgi:hypothetical protein